MRFLLLTLLVIGLSSCAGYRFGGDKPSHLAGIQSINVPLATSRVIFNRSEVFTTNAVVDALVQDGTYRLGDPETADARLVLTLDDLSYRQTRSSSDDVLRSEELSLQATVSFQLVDANNPTHILEKGSASGKSRLFVDDNLQTARRNALPDALQRAAQSIIAQLSDGI